MIEALARGTIALVLAAFAGLAVARWLRAQGIEAAGWAMALAPAFQAGLAAAMLAFGWRPTTPALLLGTAAVAALAWARVRRTPAVVRKIDPIERRILWLAGAACAAFFVAAVAEPMWTTDFVAIWGLKARTIFETGAVPSRLFHDPALFWSHPEYPLGIPISLAALAAWMGEWNDQALGLVYPWWQMATVLIAMGFLARRSGPKAGAWAAIAIALFFPLYQPAHVGTAEIPMALGFVLLATGFLDALEIPPPPGTFGRLAVAALLAATTKREGMLWAILLAAVLLGWRGQRHVRLKAVAALLLPPLAHALVMRLARGPVVARDFDLSLLAPQRWGTLIARLGEVLGRIVSVELLSIALPLAAIGLILLWTRHSFADPLLVPLGLQLSLYAFVCALSAFDPIWHVKASFGRLSFALFPAFCLVLGARLSPGKPEGFAEGLPMPPAGPGSPPGRPVLGERS